MVRPRRRPFGKQAPGLRGSCTTPAAFGADGSVKEIRGTSSTGEVWGLALGPGQVPPRAGVRLKIVWRMTGHGSLRVAATRPVGDQQPLAFGPEPHEGSSFDRPGDEWGVGVRFPIAGCYHIRLTRTGTSGDVWLMVRP